MSYEEKSTWLMAAITPAAFFSYLAALAARADGRPLAESAYEWPLILSVVGAIATIVVAHIAVSLAAPDEAAQRDERDAHLTRLGAYVGSFVMATGCANALILSLAKYEHFWIANCIFATFVLADVTSSVVKLVGYRRGL